MVANQPLQPTAFSGDRAALRSTDRTAARAVVPCSLGFAEAREARVGRMLLLRRSLNTWQHEMRPTIRDFSNNR